MDNLTNRDIQAQALAEEIITLARNTLLMHLRFMDRALGNIRTIPDMNFTFCGNAMCIRYSPWTLLHTYQEDQNLVTRNLLHCVLHNVFRHSLVGKGIDRFMWNLATDIAVEHSINELNQECLRTKRESKQQEIINYLKSELTLLTAERIYSFLTSGKVSYVEMSKWCECFEGDSHELWYENGKGNAFVTSNVDLNALWKDISKRMQTELELFKNDEGALTQNLKEINRVRYNYTEFLKRFGMNSETMRLSEEEFDNNYYTYGLELYGDIPLIEPLEYRDSRNIKDFVIAIDTSGSVQGDVVQKFVEHTHDILAGQKAFENNINMYIIQCDDTIRDIAHISSREDFDKYLKGMEITGLGRTDFRPVFAYVDKLISENRLPELRGLIYFTDGKGTFPAKAPSYKTAFVIHNDSLQEAYVPEWAIKLELPTEEIMNL